jgi:3',5'-nucleoside bisphosphate phosphatase
MIDLHTHTTESDGSFTPAELLEEAERIGLEALAITDHDTFDGYDRAVALSPRLELVCGIEISTSWEGRSTHLLAYFPGSGAPAELRAWVDRLNEGRRKRNAELARRLQSKGLEITLEEVGERAGRRVCRPHFAAVIVEKDYAVSIQDAFDRFLGEDGACYVPGDEAEFVDAVARVRASGGLPVLAHPGRICPEPFCFIGELERMRDAGLLGIEVYHTEHTRERQLEWEDIARRFSFAITGGSDFHGANKPGVALASGFGNVCVPRIVLERLGSLV